MAYSIFESNAERCGFSPSFWLFTSINQLSGSAASRYLGKQVQNTEDVLDVIEKLFSCANDMQALVDVILSCRAKDLFRMSASSLYHRFSYFCTCLMVDHKAKKRASALQHILRFACRAG